jgi:hypothetical protein
VATSRWNLLELSAASGVCIEQTFRGPSPYIPRYIYETPESPTTDQIPDDGDRDGPRNVGSIQTPDMADSPRWFHRIQQINYQVTEPEDPTKPLNTFLSHLHPPPIFTTSYLKVQFIVILPLSPSSTWPLSKRLHNHNLACISCLPQRIIISYTSLPWQYYVICKNHEVPHYVGNKSQNSHLLRLI